MTATTLNGVLLSGTHSARPSASAVANGTLYAETDTGQTYQSDGSSTWTAWGAAAGGGGIAAGTSFPGSPTTDEMFFRTDRGLLYYYDGSQWLTVNEYCMPALTGVENVSASSTLLYLPVGTYKLWIVRFEVVSDVASGNTGSAYWTYNLNKATNALSLTSLGSVSTGTGPDANATIVPHNVTIGAAVDPATYPIMTFAVTKTSTPGNLNVSSMNIIYRLIG